MKDYFALFGLQPTFHPELKQLRNKYYELSRKFHPDRFIHESEEQQAEAITKASEINEGYKVLSNPMALTQYMLTFHGWLQDDEKYQLPNNFLIEMMEINECIDAATEQLELAAEAEKMVGMQLSTLARELARAQQRYDEEGANDVILSEIKDLFFRQKYVLRLQERLTTFAPRK